MKHIITLCILFSINLLYSADSADLPQVIISLYDDTRDHAEAHALVLKHQHELSTPTKGCEVVKESLSHGHARALRDGTPMSPVLKSVDGLCTRMVLRTAEKLVGLAEFYVIKEKEDAIEANDGYIESLLFTDNQHDEDCAFFAREMLNKLRSLGAQRAVIHFVNHDLWKQQAYCTLAGHPYRFKSLEQTDFEKENNVLRFEKSLQN